MRYIILIILMAVVAILSAVAVSHAQIFCPSAFSDPAVSGNYNRQRQQSDINTNQQNKTWSDGLKNQNQPEWIQKDAKAWEKVHQYKSTNSFLLNQNPPSGGSGKGGSGGGSFGGKK